MSECKQMSSFMVGERGGGGGVRRERGGEGVGERAKIMKAGIDLSLDC